MTTVPASVPILPLPRQGIAGWLLTTDHKRIALLILSTALVFFFVFWSRHGLTDIHHKAPGARKDVHHDDERARNTPRTS